MRSYIGHRIDIPINIAVSSYCVAGTDKERFDDHRLSVNARDCLLCDWHCCLVQTLKNMYEVCSIRESNQAFKARMVAQLSYIEYYRGTIYSTEGRYLSCDDAAFEWIDQNAEAFSAGMGSN